jgi:ADP-ribose pyrophosphatase
MRGRRGKPRREARTVRAKTMFRGPVFEVRRAEVIEPSGVRAERDVVVHPGSVVVLPVLADGRIVLVRQFRYATGQYLWELVAGRLDHGETPTTAARRELLEETGYRARRLRRFLVMFPSPGFLREPLFVFLATRLTAGEAQPEEDERLLVRAFPAARLEAMLRRGKMRDAKSIAALLYYFQFLRRR